MHFLNDLAESSTVGTRKLCDARDEWTRVMKGQDDEWLGTMGLPTRFRQDAALGRAVPLFERRFDAYSRLWPLTSYGPEGKPKELDAAARQDVADQLNDWFYTDGAGLLLSGRALRQFIEARDILMEADATGHAIWDKLSRLRTDLKIDLGVRQPRERDKVAWPEEERW
jgi:hypothetical protein